MNVLINISDEIYRHAKDGSEDSNDEWNAMRAIANGTPIPDNATVCDIDAIKKRIKYEANVLDTTKGFAYCSGWMDAFKFALDIIDKYKGE